MEGAPFRVYTDRLNELGLSYMVTGSVAGIVYGEPRVTHDVDVVLELSAGAVGKLLARFPIEEFYAPPAEVVQQEIRRDTRGHFNLIHHDSGFKADIYLACDDLHRWALDECTSIDFEGTTVRVAPPEYVIVRKLQYYKEGQSEKHITDISAILAQTDVRTDAIHKWAREIGVLDLWERVARPTNV